jgi:hypothetical protein
MERRGYLLLGATVVCGALTSGFRELDVDAGQRALGSEVAELRSIAALADRENPYFDDDPTTLTGDSLGRTAELTSEGGFTALIGTHNGSDEFVVEAGTAGPARSRTVLQGTGPGTYVTGLAMAATDYRVDVAADGPWDLTLARPRAPGDEIRRLPASATGTGDAVVGPIDTREETLVRGTHAGDGQFTVELVLEASTGLFAPDTLFDGTGDIEAESRTGVAGVAWAVVTAAGSWTVSFDSGLR